MLPITRPIVRPLDSSATLSAGALGGSVFLAVLMLFTPEPAWMPVQREASLVFGGPEALAGFSFGVFALGLIVHYAWSVIVASALDASIRFFALGPAILAGAVIGVFLYAFDASVIVAMAPWVAGTQGVTMLVAHMLFGMTAAGAYEGIEDEHARRHALA